MTPQEILDTVARHLFAQGRPARDPVSGSCQYRTSDGLKCAVGALIPDEMYRPEMDTIWCSVASEIVDEFDLPSWMRENVSLLNDLQKVHDTVNILGSVTNRSPWNSTSQMRDALRRVASSHGLSTTVIDALSFVDR
jgi:hypothetical protein